MIKKILRRICKCLFPETHPEKERINNLVDNYKCMNDKVTGYDIGDPRWGTHIR